MKWQYSVKIVFTLAMLALIPGCIVILDGCNVSEFSSKVTRDDQHEMALTSGQLIEVDLHNGNIVVNGWDEERCQVDTAIEVRARTDQEAQDYLNRVEIKLIEDDGKLSIRADHPDPKNKFQICTHMTVRIPTRSNLQLLTHNGKIEIADIDGNLECKTHNGSMLASKIGGTVHYATHNGDVTARQVNGEVVLETHNGSIETRGIQGGQNLKTHNQDIRMYEVTGNLKAETHNGSINVEYVNGVEPDRDIWIKSYNGSLSILLPRDFAGKAELATHNGKIYSDVPLVVRGRLANEFRGVIGREGGLGQLFMETCNGGISIK